MTDFPRNSSRLNQQTYDRLKLSLSLDLRRQIFIAVCDDLPLRDRFAAQLQAELSHFATPTSTASSAEPRAIPRLVTLELNLHNPDLFAQVIEWLSYFPAHAGRHSPVPAFQILGIEGLTRQSAALQSVFLSYLQTIEQQLPLLESSLLLWMTQPWYRLLPEAVPEFWQCRTGTFEFIGEPTPLPVTSPERMQLPGANRELPAPPDTSPDISGDLLRSTAALLPHSSENPWLSLAEDLTLWDESDLNLEDLNLEDGIEAAPDLPPDYDQWIMAFSQVLDQKLPPVAWQEMALKLANPESQLTQPTQLTDSLHDLFTIDIDIDDLDGELSLEQAEPFNLDTLLTPALPLELEPPELEVSEQTPLLQHIELLQQQITRLEQEQDSSTVLGSAYRTLGNFYRDCIEQGDASTQNLMLAIQAYEQALQWLPITTERGETLNDLGSLYWMVAQMQSGSEEASLGLQQTIQIYEMALQSLDLGAPSHIHAIVQNNLAAVYADLAGHQQPVENLQKAIDAYRQALNYPLDADPGRSASTYNNLGTAYWNLAQHQQAEPNLTQAVSAYMQALEYYNPEQEPMNYAMIQNNLGTAYWNLAQYGRSENYLKLALTAYQAALQYRTLDAAPLSFAATQNNLGTAYWHLSSYVSDPNEQLTYLQQAIAAYNTTLKTAAMLSNDATQPALNFDLAATCNNLGLTHYQVALHQHTRLDSSRQAEHLEAALQHHIFALQSWEQNAELRQMALNCILQTLRACYTYLGMAGQNRCLSQLPSLLLSEVLPKL